MIDGPIGSDPLAEAALDDSAEELYEMAPCGYLSSTIGGQIVKAKLGRPDRMVGDTVPTNFGAGGLSTS